MEKDCEIWGRIVRYGEMKSWGTNGWGVAIRKVIPEAIAERLTPSFIYGTIGSVLPQFLISEPWNKGQFGYTTIQTGHNIPRERIKCRNATKARELDAANIFKAIKSNGPISKASFAVKRQPLVRSVFSRI